jgi:hypothetical protein
MKKKNLPKVVFLIGFSAILLIVLFLNNKQLKYVRANERLVSDKIQRICEGLDENSVLQILGPPKYIRTTSVGKLGNDIKNNYEGMLRYHYDIYLGDVPFSLEGGSWASIDIYFDSRNKKIVHKDWFIF